MVGFIDILLSIFRNSGADASIRDAHGNLYSNYLSDEAHRIHGKSMTQMRAKNQNTMVFDSEDGKFMVYNRLELE